MKIGINSSGKKYQSLVNKTVNQFFKNTKLNSETVVSFNFVSSGKIHLLNKKYRQIDKPTDVLSFPVWENLTSIPKRGAINLGDVFICPEMIQKDVKLEEIIQHSLNHLIGKHH